MYKATKIIEKFWLIFTIASFVYAIYMILFVSGWPSGGQYLIITAIAFFWWLFRRAMRKKIEKNMNQNNQKE